MIWIDDRRAITAYSPYVIPNIPVNTRSWNTNPQFTYKHENLLNVLIANRSGAVIVKFNLHRSYNE